MINIEKNEELKIKNIIGSLLLNKAILMKYPNAKTGKILIKENGFCSDFDLGNETISASELNDINKIIKKIIYSNEDIQIKRVNKLEALKLFKENEYKIEQINNISTKYITIVKLGNYEDVIEDDFLFNEKVKIDKKLYTELFNVSSAYWNNDSNNKSMVRINGIAFSTKEELLNFKNELEEAKERDHRKLGKELELFMLDDAAQGMPFWLPNGLTLYNELSSFWREIHNKNGYQEIKTPMILNEKLWHQSGHWDHYKDNMYTTSVGDIQYALKPMNCPGGMLVYKNSLHSYKDLPIRMGELGQVHRHEVSGTLNGLFRVRTFTQDDAHIFCLPSQIESEITRLMKLIDNVYKLFGFSYTVELSTRPEGSIGSDEDWELAETSLKKALKDNNIPYQINQGDGAFYGPKIDFHIKDCLGREWQCGTIQLDFQMPERFDLIYIDKDESKKRPVMLHRVVFGSIERFIGILTEHYKGAFPIWLAPTQVNVIPVNNNSNVVEYAHYINEQLQDYDIRSVLDERNEKLSYKMRQSIVKKIPMTFILGNNEMENQTISYRNYGDKNTYTDSKDNTLKLVKKLTQKPINDFKSIK